MELSPSQLIKALPDILSAKLCPMITSSPGVGKSDIVKNVANKYNLKLIDIRLSQEDPTSLAGFPVIKDKRMEFVPPTHFPLQKLDKIPDGYSGWLIFFDEMNTAPPSVQAASYKIILDRMVGKYDIHEKVLMVAAGNKKTDKAIVGSMSTAMQSRLVHVQLKVDNSDWLKWAINNKIDQRVISFIKFRKKLLHKFKPNHNDSTFATPRTWSFLSKYLDSIGKATKLTYTNLVVMAGCVSEGVAIEFKSFCEVYLKIPTLAELVANPTRVKLSKEPSFQFALTTFLSHNLMKHPTELLIVIERLPIEFQVITMREAFTIDQSMLNLPELDSWVDEHSDSLF